MFEQALEAFQNFTPEYFAFMALGVGLGLVIGFLPGLGGIVGMSLLIPFVFGMDPTIGIAMLIGMAAVTTTSDTFPAVLLGIPGTAGSQATILDGYPMARRGEAERALSGAFIVSMIGGIVGALALLFVLPVARPLMLAFGTPELFVLTILGVSMVGVLSRSAPTAGVVSGLIGMMLSTIGGAIGIPVFRYTFGWSYLTDGISIVLLGLGLFGIIELMNLLVENKMVAAEPLSRGVSYRKRDSLKDVFRHKWLVLRSAGAGSVLGMIPGIGGSVIDWLVYGATVQTSKDKSQFGKGDIRGVLAPESANNAKEGGTLVPTLFFGIPGSGTTAILLGGLILMGVEAGPNLARPENASLIYSFVWTLAIANILGTMICFASSKWIARIAVIPSRLMVPVVYVVIVGAAYQTTRHIGDVVVLLVLGVLAVVMSRVDWPRPPMLVGFVLGPSAERYFSISMERYELAWLSRTGVLILGSLVLISLVAGIAGREKRKIPDRARLKREALFAAGVMAVFAWSFFSALEFHPVARWFPLMVAGLALALTTLRLGLLGKAMWASREKADELATDSHAVYDYRKTGSAVAPTTVDGDIDGSDKATAAKSAGLRGSVVYWMAWMAGYAVLLPIVGMFAATAVWLLAFLHVESKSSRRLSVSTTVVVLVVLWAMQEQLGLVWPTGRILD